MSQKFVVRPYIASDKNFILSSWLKGLYFGNDWFSEIPANIFFKNYQKVLETILGHPDTELSVATLPDADDVILGYAVHSGDTLHWVFIKGAWRKLGIARALVPKRITTVSHLTETGRSLKHKYKYIFNPFIGGQL